MKKHQRNRVSSEPRNPTFALMKVNHFVHSNDTDSESRVKRFQNRRRMVTYWQSSKRISIYRHNYHYFTISIGTFYKCGAAHFVRLPRLTTLRAPYWPRIRVPLLRATFRSCIRHPNMLVKICKKRINLLGIQAPHVQYNIHSLYLITISL